MADSTFTINTPRHAFHKTAANRPSLTPAKMRQKAYNRHCRARFLNLLNRFRDRCKEILRHNPNQPRPQRKALPEFKQLITGNPKSIGPIPGIEVGQIFHNREELVLAGLHGRILHGIECSLPFKGRSVATCVVAKEGYYDKMDKPYFLRYAGEGGDVASSGGKNRRIWKRDQVMKRGNLALKNSIEDGNEVRVVRGVKDRFSKSRRILYVYDGVYRVVNQTSVRRLEGNVLLQFDMRRKNGQKQIDWNNVHSSAMLN